MAIPGQTSSGTATPPAMTLVRGEIDGGDAYACVPWSEFERRARRRRLVVYAGAVCVVLMAVIAVVVWNANTHYSRGRDAFAHGRYATAVEEFAAARFFTLPYRDAAALGAKAQRAVAAATATATSERRRRATVTRLLEKADESLSQGNVAEVVPAIDAARRIVPSGPLPLAAGSAGLMTQLARHIQDAAGRDLARGRWDRAVGLATAWLTLRPADNDAAALLAAARSGVILKARLDKARAAAATGRWRAARRLARAILEVRKGFPGAAAVVAEANAALAPKAASKPAAKPAAATTPAASSNAAATAPAAPPPP